MLNSSQKLSLIHQMRKMGYGGLYSDAFKKIEQHMAQGGKLIKTNPDSNVSGEATQDRKHHAGLMQGDLAQYDANTEGKFSTSPTLL